MHHPAAAAGLACALAAACPAVAFAGIEPSIGMNIDVHWTSVPEPTGQVEVTAHVRRARTVRVTAGRHRWSLKARPGAREGVRRWRGRIRKAAVTDYFARRAFRVKVTACNSSGCVAISRRLTNRRLLPPGPDPEPEPGVHTASL
jgi:hypothetical protein